MDFFSPCQMMSQTHQEEYFIARLCNVVLVPKNVLLHLKSAQSCP